jgi:hypothetical protein
MTLASSSIPRYSRLLILFWTVLPVAKHRHPSMNNCPELTGVQKQLPCGFSLFQLARFYASMHCI